ncbi:MAG: hypothetical protein ACRC2N_15340, partial [Aeromonas sp.]
AGELLHRLSIHAAKCFPPLDWAVRNAAEAAALSQSKGADPVASDICSESARLVSASPLAQALCSGLLRELKGDQLSAVYGAEERKIVNGRGASSSRSPAWA